MFSSASLTDYLGGVSKILTFVIIFVMMSLSFLLAMVLLKASEIA